MPSRLAAGVYTAASMIFLLFSCPPPFSPLCVSLSLSTLDSCAHACASLLPVGFVWPFSSCHSFRFLVVFSTFFWFFLPPGLLSFVLSLILLQVSSISRAFITSQVGGVTGVFEVRVVDLTSVRGNSLISKLPHFCSYCLTGRAS